MRAVFLGVRCLTLGVLLALAACSRQSTGDPTVQVRMIVTPSPPTVGEALITIAVSDPANQPIAGATLVLEGTMTHAGMAPTSADAREVRPGEYQAALPLSMAGDWLVTITATLPDGRVVEQTLPLNGVVAP